MRTALSLVAMLAATLVVCGSSTEGTDAAYISIGADAVETARGVAAQRGTHLQLLETQGEVALLQFPAEDLEALSEQMHEQHHRCGGFMLHETIDEGHAALAETHAVAMHDPHPIEYTLDHGDTVRAVLPALDADRILGTIRELSAMKNRYYQSESGAAASTWLAERWQSFAASRSDVTVELFDQGYAQKSVILTIPGSTMADQVVVLGGHLDSIARGGKASNAPGADDDASGIATLTEITRVLLANDFRPARTVKIMAYAAEEVGLRGSLAIVRDFQKRKINVVGAMQLDMTNYQGSDKDIWLMSDFTNPAQNTFVGQLIDTYVGATWGYDKCGYACSDHASWHRAGVPASMPFESRANERNRKIHTASDTLETSGNNAEHAHKFARVGAAFAIELAKGELGTTTAVTPARATTISSPTCTRDSWELLALAFGVAFGLGCLLLPRWAAPDLRVR